MEGTGVSAKRPSIFSLVASIIVVYVCAVATLACSTPEGEFFYGSLGLGEKRVLVATANPAAYTVLLYDLDGNLIDIVADYTSTNDIPKGIAPFDTLSFAVLLDGADRIARASLAGESLTDVTSDTNLNGALFQMANDPTTNRYFAIEANTIEAFNSEGGRIQNPYIAGTVGTCVLNTPRGIFANGDGRLLVVGTGNDRLNIYNVTGSVATCVSFNAGTGANDPIAVIQHSQNGLIYVATQVDDRIYSFPANGVGAATVAWATNLPVINNPTALLELPDGTMLVASDGTNSIERINPDGTQVGATSWARDAFTGLVTQMMLIGGE